jgi:hypothetical protein
MGKKSSGNSKTCILRFSRIWIAGQFHHRVRYTPGRNCHLTHDVDYEDHICSKTSEYHKTAKALYQCFREELDAMVSKEAKAFEDKLRSSTLDLFSKTLHRFSSQNNFPLPSEMDLTERLEQIRDPESLIATAFAAIKKQTPSTSSASSISPAAEKSTASDLIGNHTQPSFQGNLSTPDVFGNTSGFQAAQGLLQPLNSIYLEQNLPPTLDGDFRDLEIDRCRVGGLIAPNEAHALPESSIMEVVPNILDVSSCVSNASIEHQS